MVFAESFYESEETKTIPSYTGRTYGNQSAFQENTYKIKTFNYNDIVIYDISDSLKLNSVQVVSKRQYSTDDKGGYSSFCEANLQKELKLLFLDEINTSATFKNYSLDENINVTKDYLFSVTQNNVMPVVKMAVQTAPNELLIPSFLNNSFSIIKVVFEE